MNGYKTLRSLNNFFFQIELLTPVATMHIELLCHLTDNNFTLASHVIMYRLIIEFLGYHVPDLLNNLLEHCRSLGRQ